MASWQRTRVYESEEAFWADTLATNPDSWMAHNDLGNVLLRKGQLIDAINHYQKALELYPNDAKAHNNLGVAFLQKGLSDEAAAQFEKAAGINPGYPEAHNNLGNALVQKGKLMRLSPNLKKRFKSTPTMRKPTTVSAMLSFKRDGWTMLWPTIKRR
jgi:protein O-mannosyl-transferase